jgi:hypothetical protein
MRRHSLTALCLLAVVGLATLPSRYAGAGADDTKEPPKNITVTGCVCRGVEAGCWILRTGDGKSYNLISTLKWVEHAMYRVIGSESGGVTPCMQGTPLKVSSRVRLKTRCPEPCPAERAD